MELVVFTITAIVAIIGAVAMLLSRNAIHSALFLLLNFSSIAVMYLLLRAPFLFAVQLIVYAGAIIVLFLFVVMLLGAERSEDERDRIAWQRPLALALGVLLLGETAYVVLSRSGTALFAAVATGEDFASPMRVSEALFTTYLLPFEITSVILLAALVGVVVLHQPNPRTGEPTEQAVQTMADIAPEPTRSVASNR
ncbi:MAG: NADH-quinone oxidoreductase subunit J [Kouleothrix sp.]|nr:NADH-quinone oxidoreductase subunit J [Kouleothrix sp.]